MDWHDFWQFLSQSVGYLYLLLLLGSIQLFSFLRSQYEARQSRLIEEAKARVRVAELELEKERERKCVIRSIIRWMRMNRTHCTRKVFASKNFRLNETEDGFRVEGRDRHPVHVRLAPSQTAWLVCINQRRVSACVNLYAYPSLVEAISSVAMCQWQRPASHPSTWDGVYQWARSRTRLALNRRVYAQWQRLLARVPETKRQVAKVIFAATFSMTEQGCEAWDELYEYPYLIKDMLNYRAAAIACHNAFLLTWQLGVYLSYQYKHDTDFTPNQEQKRLIDFYLRWFSGDDLAERFDPEKPICRRELLDLLARDWKALFSFTLTAGSSLRRTLMNLPGGISAKMLSRLPFLEPVLSRPMTDRVELITLLSFGVHATKGSDSYPWEGSFYAKARRNEILSAMNVLSKHLRRRLTAKSAHIAELVQFLRDYCSFVEQEELPHHPQQGNIVGLTEKAITWHRERGRQNIEIELAKYEGRAGTPVALPPIPLPDKGAVTFLATIGEIVREETEMQHGIASYAQSAVAGCYYLFHVEYKGTVASIQLDSGGHVIQSFGPLNQINDASIYGKRILTQWGMKLQQALHQENEGFDPLDDRPF